MFIRPGQFQGKLSRRMIIAYIFVTGIPCVLIMFYVNIFIGPAQLAEIPEGYEPYHWEYEKHPIRRFIAKHFRESGVANYEKAAAIVQIEGEKMKQRKIEGEVRKMMRQRGDSTWYHSPIRQPPKSEDL